MALSSQWHKSAEGRKRVETVLDLMAACQDLTYDALPALL